MGEYEEFAEALIDQIGVELEEEREIAGMASRIADDPEFKAGFEPLEDLAGRVFAGLKDEVAGFTGMDVPGGVRMEFPELADIKVLKGKKVAAPGGARGFVDGLFGAISTGDTGAIAEMIRGDTARFLVYSTYAKSYISKITTTYGDYLDPVIYLNRFVLSRYPQIILYRRGAPYDAGFEEVSSGYRGAVKMTVLEELVHSVQGGMHKANWDAVLRVNELNEELAGIILGLGDDAARGLTDHLRLQAVPDDFPVALRANLFFTLNPDNFVMNVLGPDVLTYTNVEVDPKIAGWVPQLEDIYRRWLGPIQVHEAAFSVMEGMAEFCVHGMLAGDADFQEYLRTFMGTDVSAYGVRKSMGKGFVGAVFERHQRGAFERIVADPPSTRELKDPQTYLDRIAG